MVPTVGTPATAKNCITVGASENLRPTFTMPPVNHPFAYGDGWPSDFPVNPIHDDPVANNPDGMAAFSSRGPAIHNRVRGLVPWPGGHTRFRGQLLHIWRARTPTLAFC